MILKGLARGAALLFSIGRRWARQTRKAVLPREDDTQPITLRRPSNRTLIWAPPKNHGREKPS